MIPADTGLNKYNQLRFLVMILMPGMVVWYLFSILHKKVVQICSDIGNLVPVQAYGSLKLVGYKLSTTEQLSSAPKKGIRGRRYFKNKTL